MTSARVKAGHLLAKVLGIKINNGVGSEDLTRGESVISVQTADSFIERQPTSDEWVQDLIPSRHDILEYTRSLFPFTYWIGHYNLQWFFGDLVAGKSFLDRAEHVVNEHIKASPLALSSCHKVWHMPAWLICNPNLGCIRRLWVSSSIGSLQRPRILQLE